MSPPPVKLVVHAASTLAACLVVGGFAALAAGCDAETQAPRGAAYPDVVGYDTPEQAPTSGTTTPSQALEQQQRLAALQQIEQNGGALGDASGETPIGADTEGYADTDPSALTDFRAALDPYGSWTEDPTYGTVWMPSASVVGDDFSPYDTGGHWSYDDDYVWVSDYDWGWAPFHYGRWAYMGGGWGWIPGREYAGAWVSWRTGNDGYVGWGAMPPTWGWRGGMAVGIGVVPPVAYTFCNTHDLFSPSIAGHALAGPQVASIAAHTQPYVGANPGVHVLAHPGVAGPPPVTMLHIPASEVAHAPLGDRGLMRAQQFSHPAGAQLAGAHAPAGFAGGQRYASYARNTGYARSGFPGGAVAGHALLPRGGSMMPAYGRPAGFAATRIGGGYAGGNGAAAYSYGSRGGSFAGSGFRGSSGFSSFRGGSSFGGSSFRGGGSAAPSGGHYFGSSGGFSGGHASGGGGGGHGGGHGGGGHR